MQPHEYRQRERKDDQVGADPRTRGNCEQGEQDAGERRMYQAERRTRARACCCRDLQDRVQQLTDGTLLPVLAPPALAP